MPHIKHLLILVSLAVGAPSVHAFECFQSAVDGSSVAHLAQSGRLYFLAPSRMGEVGQMIIVSGETRARSAVHWKNKQPVEYKFDAVPGRFVRGVREGGGNALESRAGSFAVNEYGGRLVILVEPGAPRRYELTPVSDRECGKVFPASARAPDDDAYLD